MKMRSLSQNCKLHMKDNRGASLVTVIITIALVGVLVSTLMTTSLINIKMKQMNKHSKDSFYSAERVLDEINVGLQRYVSDALGRAYQDVLVNYMTYPTEQKVEILQTHYYENLWSYLEVGGENNHKHYDLDKIRAFVKPSTMWRGDEETGSGAIIVAGTSDDDRHTDKGVMETYDKKGVVLKDLRVYYKDSKGFVSIIHTDICLSMPNFEFAPSTDLPDIPSHSIIADEGLFYGNEKADGSLGVAVPTGAKVDIKGDIYADRLVLSQSDSNSKISIIQEGEFQTVVRNDIKMNHGSFVNNELSELWAEDIVAKSSNLNLLGDTNVADDLNIKGDSSIINLGKVYNGYGNSMSDEEKSSAILLNGTNVTLNLEKLDVITVAGHAFIGTKKINDGNGGIIPENERNNIYTGESIAVKSNQLLYLIPGECIGVDEVTKKSKYNKNPLTKAEYEDILSRTGTMDLVSTDVTIDKLGGTLASYMKMSADNKGELHPVPEKVFVKSSDPNNQRIYFYMSFQNEKAANLYFEKMFMGNQNQIADFAKAYVKEVKFPITESLLRLKIAAGSVRREATEEQIVLLPTVLEDANHKLEGNKEIYSKRFDALCTKLITNSHDLTTAEKQLADYPDEGIVFDNLVNSEYLKKIIKDQTGSEIGTVKVKGSDMGSTKGDLILSTEDVTISDTDTDLHLVITTGDVTVDSSNFEGTVLSDKTVRITTANGKFKAVPEVVSAMLRYQINDGTNDIMVANVLKGGSEYIFASLDGNAVDLSTDLSKLVKYENWKKE